MAYPSPHCNKSIPRLNNINPWAYFQGTGRPAFVWRDVPSGEEIVTMVNP
eukprot:SAG11_NODE_42_length_20827_cov_9.289801_8_plen_50_part_00